MSAEQINVLMFELLPLIIALSAIIYKIFLMFLPANRQAELQNVTNLVNQVAGIAVASTEQTHSGQPGEVKLASAANDVLSHLNAYGVKVPATMISNAIEANVLALKQSKPIVLPEAVQSDVTSLSTQQVAAIQAR